MRFYCNIKAYNIIFYGCMSVWCVFYFVCFFFVFCAEQDMRVCSGWEAQRTAQWPNRLYLPRATRDSVPTPSLGQAVVDVVGGCKINCQEMNMQQPVRLECVCIALAEYHLHCPNSSGVRQFSLSLFFFLSAAPHQHGIQKPETREYIYQKKSKGFHSSSRYTTHFLIIIFPFVWNLNMPSASLGSRRTHPTPSPSTKKRTTNIQPNDGWKWPKWELRTKTGQRTQ